VEKQTEFWFSEGEDKYSGSYHSETIRNRTLEQQNQPTSAAKAYSTDRSEQYRTS
jgi:hypothetical protein